MNTCQSLETKEETKVTDTELVEQSKLGDQRATAELIRRHYSSSLRIAHSIVRNHAEAEDAAQEAYCLAFRHIHSFREEARFSTWIGTIVVNQCRMMLRRQRRAVLINLDESAPRHLKSAEASPEETAYRSETSHAISRAVARLPIELRMPYALHAISGLPLFEVAHKLGISIAATKSRIFRARCTLESRLHSSFARRPRGLQRC